MRLRTTLDIRANHEVLGSLGRLSLVLSLLLAVKTSKQTSEIPLYWLVDGDPNITAHYNPYTTG